MLYCVSRPWESCRLHVPGPVQSGKLLLALASIIVLGSESHGVTTILMSHVSGSCENLMIEIRTGHLPNMSLELTAVPPRFVPVFCNLLFTH